MDTTKRIIPTTKKHLNDYDLLVKDVNDNENSLFEAVKDQLNNIHVNEDIQKHKPTTEQIEQITKSLNYSDKDKTVNNKLLKNK
eukprot:UN28456